MWPTSVPSHAHRMHQFTWGSHLQKWERFKHTWDPPGHALPPVRSWGASSGCLSKHCPELLSASVLSTRANVHDFQHILYNSLTAGNTIRRAQILQQMEIILADNVMWTSGSHYSKLNYWQCCKASWRWSALRGQQPIADSQFWSNLQWWMFHLAPGPILMVVYSQRYLVRDLMQEHPQAWIKPCITLLLSTHHHTKSLKHQCIKQPWCCAGKGHRDRFFTERPLHGSELVCWLAPKTLILIFDRMRKAEVSALTTQIPLLIVLGPIMPATVNTVTTPLREANSHNIKLLIKGQADQKVFNISCTPNSAVIVHCI